MLDLYFSENGYCTAGLQQCDQIGRFFNFFGDKNYLQKVASQIVW